MSWAEFCKLYFERKQSRLSKSAKQSWKTTKKHVEELAPLASIEGATSAWVAEWQAKLRKRLKSQNSVATYSAHLRAALRWAERLRIIDRAPYVPTEWEEVAGSRAITGEELDRILAAVKLVRPDDWTFWDRLIRGLSWTNLRIGELARLSWEPDGEIRIEWHGGYPHIRKPPRSHKGRKDRLEPILPQFWAVCLESPEQVGLVFPMPNGQGGNMTQKRIVRTISKIGEKAGVVTNPDKLRAPGKDKDGNEIIRRKTATSHDIGRRAFVPIIDAGTLTQAEVHKAMGHASFQTTTTYYDTRTSVEIAAKIWGDKKPERRSKSGATGGASNGRKIKPAAHDKKPKRKV